MRACFEKTILAARPFAAPRWCNKMSFPVDGRLALLCALAVSMATPSFAQMGDMPDADALETQSEPLDLNKLDPSIDWSVLGRDASTFIDAQGRTITVVPTSRDTSPKWNRTINRDGSAAVTASRALPTVWDTRVGMDFGLAPPPSPLITPDRLVAGGAADQSSGVAWARATAPGLNLPIGWDRTSIDARFDPLQEQSRFGSRFSRSLPLGEDMSVTMESGFAVTHLRAQPLPNDLSGGHTVNILDSERLAKLNFLTTGTSIGAGSRKSSVDDVWLNSLSAEQKLFGGLSITGSISETAEGETDKSLTAGFKRSW
jgi:hypothetical protein